MPHHSASFFSNPPPNSPYITLHTNPFSQPNKKQQQLQSQQPMDQVLAAHSETHSALEAVADATLLVDNHAHPFWIPDVSQNTYSMPKLADVLNEATTPSQLPTPQAALTARGTLAFCRSLRDLYALVVPDPLDNDDESHGLDTPERAEITVEKVRAEMGPWNLAKRCFGAAGIAAVLIDDGISCPVGGLPVELTDFPTRLNVPVAKRVLRLESEAEAALSDIVARNDSNMWRRKRQSPDKRPRTTLRAQMFRAELNRRLNPLPKNVVSFKSIAAYRSGLAINLDWTDENLEDALASMSFPAPVRGRTERIRLEHCVIIDCVVRAGLDAARQHNIPIQFHCGFGDTDLDLLKANPLLLRQVFERYPDVNIVLLHAAWPYTRNAAYLTSVYPRVFLDLGLSIPLLSVRGMFRAVDEALEIAPITKLLYSSDAHSVPDSFYLAARWGRRVVAAVIAASVASGDLGQAEAKAAIRKILAENAIHLYKLPIFPQS